MERTESRVGPRRVGAVREAGAGYSTELLAGMRDLGRVVEWLVYEGTE